MFKVLDVIVKCEATIIEVLDLETGLLSVHEKPHIEICGSLFGQPAPSVGMTAKFIFQLISKGVS